jgi:uncharacterized protein YlxP (DUF503 family)
VTIALCRIALRIPTSHSLKAKRQVVRSVIGRVRERFTVSIAEVDSLDAWQMAGIGFACVSNDESHASEMVSEIVNFIERMSIEGEVLSVETEIVHAL